MYQMLVPVDDDENRALNQARYVASLPDAESAIEATVLAVAPPSSLGTAEDVEFAEFEAAMAAAAHLESQGVQVARRVGDGGVGEEIVRIADELDSDEIVMGGRKRSGVAPLLLGSTVREVFVSTERPVTITGTGMAFDGGPRELLVPVDRNVERARQQADYVAGLPDPANNVSATVLYVFPHQDYAGAPPHEFAEIGAAVAAADRLEAEGVAVERVATGGEVTRKILAAAEDREADGIVMGGRKRSGVQKVLLGSIAQDVMLSADRPVTLTG
ncbi:universal stress protein [Halobellus rufus]|uniref:universal stress protein n=1 Tax=Halobellus rufus TaxID=1448860 RepID=UPI0006792AC8